MQLPFMDLGYVQKMTDAGEHSEAMKWLMSTLPLPYMASCCYYFLFQLGMCCKHSLRGVCIW